MSTSPEEPDFNDPTSVVRCFIQAMNRWEKESWEAQRACRSTPDASSYQAGVASRMDEIFRRFCTPKERPFGRCGSFSRPPEYDPDKEQVLSVEIDENRKRADIITHREAILGGGRHRYRLMWKDRRWLIDTLKRETNGGWENAIL